MAITTSTTAPSSAPVRIATTSENNALRLPSNISNHVAGPPLFQVEDDDTANNETEEETEEDEDGQPDPSWICPLTLEIMRDPLMDRKGLNFERHAIVEWLNRGNATCPLTRQPLSYSKLVPNAALRLRIEQWKRDHKIPIETTSNTEKSSPHSKLWDEEYWNGGEEDDGEEFPITVASPLSYQQQLFLVTALGQEYSLAERRQLMAEYRQYHFPNMAMTTVSSTSDTSRTNHHSGSSNSRRNRRRRHSIGGSSSSPNGSSSSSRRDRSSSNNNGSSNNGLTPRSKRRLLSTVLDNALSVLRLDREARNATSWR